MALAIFDLDNTLLNGDSDHAWGEYLVQQGKVDAQAYQEANDYFYQQYKQAKLDIYEYLDFALKPLTQHSNETLMQWHDEFMQITVEPMLQEQAFELLEKHRDAGDFLLIITATNAFVTHPIAKRLGVDAILATDPEIIEGKYTGAITGTPCFQDGKITRLNSWLATQDLDLTDSYFYSDSINDLPLLEIVDNPVVVDGDELLLAAADKNQWPCISLRD